MAAMRLLLIDDDEQLGPPLAAWFQRHNVELVQATSPSAGLKLLGGGNAGNASNGNQPGQFDAAILDVMLPEMDGFALCRTIRKTSDLPLIMLTARGDVMDRVVGLELGADDYLPKPFEPRELLARLQTILRRTKAASGTAVQLPASSLRYVGLHIDLAARSVLASGQRVELTGTEFELLALLAGKPNTVFSRDDILNQLRGHDALDIHSRAVDILVSRLRRKLEPLDPIRTLRNAGYIFAGVPE
jgi:two-component system OmpR family response regulator